MRILLSAPPLRDLGDPGSTGHVRACPSLGLYLLAAVVKGSGHQVKVVDPVHFEDAFGQVESAASALEGVDVLGVSVNSCTWPRARKLLADLESLPERPVTVLGGPHPSLFDEHILAVSPVDYIVRGEGEKAFPLLLERISEGQDASVVPGVSFRGNGEVVRSDPGLLLTPDELVALPAPLFDLMPQGYYEVIPVETSRGCFHTCVFCSVTYRRSWRGIESSAVADRLNNMSAHLEGTTKKSFFIIDDCFTADHERLRAISGKLSGFPHRLIFEARIPDVISEGVIEAIESLPVRVMEMGVECGYEEGLKKVGKKLTLDQVERAAEFIDQHGLSRQARFSFIMGLPWEARKDVMKTLEYAFKLAGSRGSRLAANWLTVFPGSIIWRKRKEWGIDLEIDDFDRDEWWSEPDVFKRCHPRLELYKDVEDIAAYVQMLMRLFPEVQHDGWFRYLP